MKTRYLILICILFAITIGFVILLFYSPLGEHPRLEKVIHSMGLFVALIAAIIALATADRKIRVAKVKIEQFIDRKNIETYDKNTLSDELIRFFQNSSDPVESYRVQFKMTNISGFTLKNPTLTFRLPLQKQHPQKIPRRGPDKPLFEKFSVLNFRSNLFNSQTGLRVLEFADTRILSNSNLPYWNNQDEMTIWIRMVLDNGDSESFVVEISVNCDNAEGVTEKVTIKPKKN